MNYSDAQTVWINTNHIKEGSKVKCVKNNISNKELTALGFSNLYGTYPKGIYEIEIITKQALYVKSKSWPYDRFKVPYFFLESLKTDIDESLARRIKIQSYTYKNNLFKKVWSHVRQQIANFFDLFIEIDDA